MDVGIHGAAPADGIAGKKEETAEAFDLVEIIFAIIATNLGPVFLDQKRHEVPAVAFAVPLDAAALVEKRSEDPGIGIAHAVGSMICAIAHCGRSDLAPISFVETILRHHDYRRQKSAHDRNIT